MSVSRNENEGPRHSPELDELERLHQSVLARLGGALTRDYLLTEDEARELIRHSLCAYLQVSVPSIPEVGVPSVPPDQAETWLVSVVCTDAELRYHERKAMSELRRKLETLPPDEQRAVRLRLYQKWSYEQIAADLNVTVAHAEQLVLTALKKLR